MDINMDDDGVTPIPISPITFQVTIAPSLQAVPVVFIVNDVLRKLSHSQMDKLAKNLIGFVGSKLKQAGKPTCNELQIDCDWTGETRDNYFYLLKQIKLLIGRTTLSVTLRLHQVKNRKASGIPPAGKVLLMCYNMGNLRKYGPQNSIMELSELKKYVGDNLQTYPMPMDVGLPLFSWAVAFRNKTYIGIDKRVNEEALKNTAQFTAHENNLYTAKTDLPAFGLQKDDEVRWENVSMKQVDAAASYLSNYITSKNITIVWFHLDDAIIKRFQYEDFENAANLLR